MMLSDLTDNLIKLLTEVSGDAKVVFQCEGGYMELVERINIYCGDSNPLKPGHKQHTKIVVLSGH